MVAFFAVMRKAIRRDLLYSSLIIIIATIQASSSSDDALKMYGGYKGTFNLTHKLLYNRRAWMHALKLCEKEQIIDIKCAQVEKATVAIYKGSFI